MRSSDIPTRFHELPLRNGMDFISLFAWVRSRHEGTVWACFPTGRPRRPGGPERVDLARLDRVVLALTLMDLLDDPTASRLQCSDAADRARFDMEMVHGSADGQAPTPGGSASRVV